ncbi:DUF89 family protein [bacterium]|nr:DUF89 family protein [bacterium]
MKSDIVCLHCLMKQAVNTVRITTDDPGLHRQVCDRTADLIKTTDLSMTPAAISTPVYRIVSEVTGNPDPYAEFRKRTNAEALSLLPVMRRAIDASEDPLTTGLHVAVAGNIIDLGIGVEFDLVKDLERALATPFAVDDSEAFRPWIRPGTSLLYLTDNSGEIVFDRALTELFLSLGVKVTLAVKSGPVINDVMRADAEEVGLADLAPVIETGSDDIGVDFSRISEEFLEAFTSADVILAKGHGNFESCNQRPENIFFLLRAKCEVVARELGVRVGDIVCKTYR